jgi:hypothetical protein
MRRRVGARGQSVRQSVGSAPAVAETGGLVGSLTESTPDARTRAQSVLLHVSARVLVRARATTYVAAEL